MPTAVVKQTVGEFNVVGFSLAGEETAVALPEHNVCFDAGRAPREIVSVDNLCVTHGHMDHAAGVPYYLSQRNFLGAPPGRVITHRDMVPRFEALMACWAQIEGHRSPGEFVGLLPGEEFAIRRNLVLRAFDVLHSPCSLGFSLIEKRHKLRPEFADHTGPQLVELKKKGIPIENTIEVPLAAYCGDTPDGSFFDLDHVRNAKLVIMECTFFDPDHLHRARVGKHLHAKDLPGILPRLRSPNILLIHLTRRTDLREAKRILAACVDPVDLARITYLMERPRRPIRNTPSNP